MNTPDAMLKAMTLPAVSRPENSNRPRANAEGMTALALRVRGEFAEMPGLRLTAPQAARLFGIQLGVAHAVLEELRRASVLACSNHGMYSLLTHVAVRHGGSTRNGHATMADSLAQSGIHGSLRTASVDRLTCLLRHWTWADEAKQRFEQELAGGFDYDEDLVADHPFGSYYHWCALLCGLSEAALEHGLLAPPQLDAIRQDLELTLRGLRECRELLVVIPASLKEQPLLVDLLRDDETLGRLRRVHAVFGEALHEEQMSREIESLDH
jgi:hypothetical protein